MATRIKKLIKLFVGISFIIALTVYAIPTYANIGSCKCEKVYDDGSGSAPVGFCKPINTITECAPSLFFLPSGGYDNEVDRTNGYRISCKIYRDASCLSVFGSTDPDSKFNPCWSKSLCVDKGGRWDESGINKLPCVKYGSTDTARCFVVTPDIQLQVPIPGYGGVVKGGFPAYLAAFYKFFVAALAVVAVVMVMWGGFKRVMAAGSSEKIKGANETIAGAITGLVLALLSFTVLNLINPKLVENAGINIDKVKPQFFDNWCPDEDPLDPSIKYFCGEPATVDANSCLGKLCYRKGSNGEPKGCYKTGDTGGKGEGGYLLKDYECLTNQEICRKTNSALAFELHGLTYPVLESSIPRFDRSMNNLCNRYSIDGSACVYGVPKEDGGCLWYPKSYIDTTCATARTCIGISGLGINVDEKRMFCVRDLCKFGCKYTVGGDPACG